MIRNVQELLENSAEKYPDKIAFKDKNNLVTYSELMLRAQSIGTFLSKRGVSNRPVIVLTDRNVESIVMFFGVVYSGNFYVPIDVNQPAERIKAILNIIDPEMIIGRRENISIFKFFKNTLSCIYEDIIEFESDVFLLHNIRKKLLIQIHCAVFLHPDQQVFQKAYLNLIEALFAWLKTLRKNFLFHHRMFLVASRHLILMCQIKIYIYLSETDQL